MEANEATTQTQDGASGGIVKTLGELPPGAILAEEEVARIFGRHTVSVKRAVKRGELPPPARLFGRPVWTAGAILAHLDARLEAAKREADRQAARFARHSA
jgi:hypothetical protein